MQGYSKKELEAYKNAKDKGVPFSDDYKLPYQLEYTTRVAIAIMGVKFHRMKFNDFCAYSVDQLPKIMYRVVCEGEVPMSDWYASKQTARKLMESFNVRHFKVASLSDNPKCPVLL